MQHVFETGYNRLDLSIISMQRTSKKVYRDDINLEALNYLLITRSGADINEIAALIIVITMHVSNLLIFSAHKTEIP